MGSEGATTTEVAAAVATPMDRLVDAIEAVSSQSLEGVPLELLGDRLTSLRSAIDRLECESTRTLTRFDAEKGFEESGAVDTVAWLRNGCRLSFGAAAER